MNHIEGSQRGELLVCKLGDFFVGFGGFTPRLHERFVAAKLQSAVIQFWCRRLGQAFLGAFRGSRLGETCHDKLGGGLRLGLCGERRDNSSRQVGLRSWKRRCSDADSRRYSDANSYRSRSRRSGLNAHGSRTLVEKGPLVPVGLGH